ncbi:hypothetical protein CARUB_v10016119mg [Capsella rubella]|uniref:Bidirectional sugar transporter SWEET n=1 Tax=Capsella rubella TaxID=81985 RepID=R0I8G4_9BRAS|nr:hypothetical protein CARUB_v10016119mg [Capsella rubella]
MIIIAKDIRIIIGVIGKMICISLLRANKKLSVGEYQHDRQIVIMTKCSLWILYGIPFVYKDGILVTTSNGLGFIIEAIYLVIVWINCDNKKMVFGSLLWASGFVSTFYVITLMIFARSPYKHILVGVVCDVFNICVYLNISLNKMSETKNYTYMPFWLSVVSFINAGSWTAYSLIYKIDIFVLINSGVETLFCAFQLVVHACSCIRQLCVSV